MKTKLHFGIIVALLIFLGRYIESSTTPNQQIVIQFSDAQINKSDVQDTIESIQNKLQYIGVEYIKVDQSQEGKLKITYFSDSDVEQIKNILTSEGEFKFAHNPSGNNSDNIPNSRSFDDYQLNISEIQNNSHVNWYFEKVEIVEFNHKSDRFNNPKVKVAGFQFNSELANHLVDVSVKSFKTAGFSIDNFSYKIPEVRAGPIA